MDRHIAYTVNNAVWLSNKVMERVSQRIWILQCLQNKWIDKDILCHIVQSAALSTDEISHISSKPAFSSLAAFSGITASSPNVYTLILTSWPPQSHHHHYPNTPSNSPFVGQKPARGFFSQVRTILNDSLKGFPKGVPAPCTHARTHTQWKIPMDLFP